MMLKDGWSWGTLPGDDKHQEERYAYRRYNGHDRLHVLGVWQRSAEQLFNCVDPITVAQEGVEIECRAMADRLVRSDGSGWTDAELLELNGVRPEAFAHLSRTLYGPAYDELDQDCAKKNSCETPLRYLRGIQRLLCALVSNVSVTSMSHGTPPTESVGGFSETISAAATGA